MQRHASSVSLSLSPSRLRQRDGPGQAGPRRDRCGPRRVAPSLARLLARSLIVPFLSHCVSQRWRIGAQVEVRQRQTDGRVGERGIVLGVVLKMIK